jgi:hypothetical protein
MTEYALDLTIKGMTCGGGALLGRRLGRRL